MTDIFDRLAEIDPSFCAQSGPCLEDVRSFADLLFNLMFPIGRVQSCGGRKPLDEILRKNEYTAKNLLGCLLSELAIPAPADLVRSFWDEVPEIYQAISLDAVAHFERDPAASSILEVTLAYPGFLGVGFYRIAHALAQRGVPLLPRIIASYAQERSGIDIHPKARIGKSFAIDHGTGVVIGETADIGDNVQLYQGVTLGALSVAKDKASIKRHPTVGDRVVIYANATILGGQTVIGDDSVIGGNAWVVESVAPGSRVLFR